MAEIFSKGKFLLPVSSIYIILIVGEGRGVRSCETRLLSGIQYAKTEKRAFHGTVQDSLKLLDNQMHLTTAILISKH